MTTDLIIELYHMVPLDEKKHHVVSLATSYYLDLITVTVAGAGLGLGQCNSEGTWWVHHVLMRKSFPDLSHMKEHQKLI